MCTLNCLTVVKLAADCWHALLHLLDHQQHAMLENFHIPDLKLGLTKMHPRLMRDLLQIKRHHRYSYYC